MKKHQKSMIERAGEAISSSVRNINQTYKTLETGFDAYMGVNKFLVSLCVIEELTLLRNHEGLPPAILSVMFVASSAPAAFSMALSYFAGRDIQQQAVDSTSVTFANENQQITK